MRAAASVPMPTSTSLRRNIAVLATCQALFFVANTVVASTSPLVGLGLAPSPVLATLPLGIQFVGTMVTTMPASLLMERHGRRPGLLVGSTFGVAAGLAGFVAIMQGWFWLFCLSGALYGAFGAFCQYFRFTAADAADVATGPGGGHAGGDSTRTRARAIGWVFAGGTVAAVAGPQLAKATRDLFEPFLFAGCQLAVLIVAAMVGLVLLGLDLPLPMVGSRKNVGRSTALLLADPAIRRAFLVALVAYLSMNLLMTATPLAMLGCGYSFDASATVIQWHVIGMFGPSFVTGHLIARFGARPVVLAGAATIACCIIATMTGQAVAHFAVGLLLLGVGWNLMFVGATAMLTSAHAPEEKARVQGLHDLLLFSCVAVSATSSGALETTLGWQLMNLAVLPGLIVVALLLTRLANSTRAA